jgi:protein-disulfide isomerase
MMLVVGVLATAACNQAKAVKGTAKSCEDYAKRICKESSEEAEACKTMKAASELLPPDACATGLAKIDFTVKKLKAQGKKCTELEAKLCADLGPETPTCAMVKERTKEFPPERCAGMMEHYAEVLADLKRQEAKNKPLGEDQIAKLTAGAVPAFGPADAKVTIVEFSDFQCPFCSKAANVTTQVKEKYGDKVRFVFRHFPLPFHPNAHEAAEASLAADAQGKFWPFHDKLFANQSALDRKALEGYAKELGMDVPKLKKALDEKTFAAQVDADMKLGEEASVDGTPTMFLNGARVPNPTDFDALSKQIDSALAGG